jgi:hypothetical protein
MIETVECGGCPQIFDTITAMEYREIGELRLDDVKTHPVWEYVNDDQLSETTVRPVKHLPLDKS